MIAVMLKADKTQLSYIASYHYDEAYDQMVIQLMILRYTNIHDNVQDEHK